MVKYSGPAYQHKEETKQDDKQNGLINKTDKTHLTRQRNEKVPFFHHNQDKEKTDSMKRTRKRITQTNKDGKTTPFLKKERSSTPFKGRTVPSSYFRAHKKIKEKTKQDNELVKLKNALQKKEEEFLLFDGWLSERGEASFNPTYKETPNDNEGIKNKENKETIFSLPAEKQALSENKPSKFKRKNLTRSLAGMIAEEKKLGEDREKRMGYYFNSVTNPFSVTKNNITYSANTKAEEKDQHDKKSVINEAFMKEKKGKKENNKVNHSWQQKNEKKDAINTTIAPKKEQSVDLKEEDGAFKEIVQTNSDEKTVNQAAYAFPPLGLLKEPVQFETSAVDDWVLKQAERLNETMDAFNISAQVISWTIGPAVTQFELQLARGVKVSKITNLSDDLKLSLAAKDIRIEAPVPGKNTVGVEIPNQYSRPVMLSEVMHSAAFRNNASPLTVAIGINLSGKAIVTTLDKMPHGLIAGATGSGKSVFINSLLVSLLYKAKPSEVKMILIDPKAVELAPYNDIPHLLSPVISEPKAANEALKWTVNEMEERYKKLAAAGAKNIQQYNQKAEAAEDYGLKIPYIVVVIDELADLMMVASSEVQDSIARITQKARAAGIHLIVATQRPSVDVITGTIKNNIPSRIAFMVSSQVDSRTIIDVGGAEKLLGKGDMLFLGNGSSQAVRLQGTFIDEEIYKIVDHVKEQRKPNYAFQPESLMKKAETIEEKDELFEDVLSYIVETGQVSASSLQRRFKIGFNRAASLIESLEQENIISGNKGSKPREVFLTRSDYEEKFL